MSSLRLRLHILALSSSVAVLACTPKESGPTLWAKACKRTLETIDDATPERRAECEADMASHPRAIADDMARCIMKGPAATSPEAEREAFKACISSETQAHLDKRAAAWLVLDEVAEALERYTSNDRPLPASLAEVPGAATEGPWGHPLSYRPEGETYDLCVVGPDGRADSHDDLCRLIPFVYFQF